MFQLPVFRFIGCLSKQILLLMSSLTQKQREHRPGICIRNRTHSPEVKERRQRCEGKAPLEKHRRFRASQTKP